jgi:uncharacterized membrane protein YkoI
LAVLVTLWCAAPAHSEGVHAGSRRIEYGDEHDEARALVSRGDIRPLPEVLKAIQSQVSGEVIDVRLRRKDVRWIYFCKVVTPSGERVTIAVDAARLAILDGERDD